MEPLKLLHAGAVKEDVTVIGAGLPTITVLIKEHALSVIVTEYVPATRFVIVLLLIPLDQA